MSERSYPGKHRSHIVYTSSLWALARVALFHPTAGDGGSGDDNPGGGANDENLDDDGAGNAGKDGNEGGGEQKKLVTLERHKEEVNKLKAKLKTFEDADTARKKSEMTELEREKAEKKELQDKLSRFESDEKKSDALLKAKKALAKEGKIIDPEKEDALIASLKGMAYDEATVDERVTALVNLAAAPKGGGYKTVAGKVSKETDDDRDPRTYSPKELREIRNESTDRYDSIMAKRKQLDANDRVSKRDKN